MIGVRRHADVALPGSACRLAGGRGDPGAFPGPQAGQIARTNALQKPFQTLVGVQGRGDAALAAFARATGYEAITMDRRLLNFITQTLRDPSIPIRGVPR